MGTLGLPIGMASEISGFSRRKSLVMQPDMLATPGLKEMAYQLIADWARPDERLEMRAIVNRPTASTEKVLALMGELTARQNAAIVAEFTARPMDAPHTYNTEYDLPHTD